jgi:hypothetical protein
MTMVSVEMSYRPNRYAVVKWGNGRGMDHRLRWRLVLGMVAPRPDGLARIRRRRRVGKSECRSNLPAQLRRHYDTKQLCKISRSAEPNGLLKQSSAKSGVLLGSGRWLARLPNAESPRARFTTPCIGWVRRDVLAPTAKGA